ncbi:unnamed protein product [Prunus armeniaca]|uniref:Uncharacterized protein n=1 Tax=Prunus armeniaca TaxID=36596 RepID=A0A6J5XR94_PRUAR|nr:unnamed protein product [Prunus armeniaca]
MSYMLELDISSLDLPVSQWGCVGDWRGENQKVVVRMVAVALVKGVDVKGGVWGEFVGIGGLWPVERDRFRRSSSYSSISEGLEGFVV